MEFAAAALTAVSTTVAEVGTSVAATASEIGASVTGTVAGAVGPTSLGGAPLVAGATTGSLLSAVGPLSLVGSILAGTATAASVLNQQNAAIQNATALNLQADDADLSARVESVQGLDRRNSLKAALVQAVGDRDVAAAASGVDLSFGTPATARREAIRDGERALDVDQATEDFRKARLKEKAGNLRLAANNAYTGGLGTAAATALQGAASLFRRG